MINKLIEWTIENFSVLFSDLWGYAISLIIAIILGYLFFQRKAPNNNVKQKNIVAGGDVTGRDKKG